MTTLTNSMINPGFLLAIVVFVHATFQAGVSVLTLLSGHSFRAKQAHHRLLQLNSAYVAGVIVLTILITSLVQLIARTIPANFVSTAWLAVWVLALIVGFAIIKSYYRRGKGTVLWLPRPIAQYLTKRAEKTKHPVEAFSLGMTTVVAELPFSMVLFAIIGLVSYSYSPEISLALAISYALLTAIPLLCIVALIGGGHRISQIQRWREQNKSFLQYSAGAGMIVVAVFIASFYLIGATS